MSAPEAAGPGRRLTDAEEQQAAVLFAAGHSTRQVAAALGIGNGTAARLRQRLAARSASATSSPEDTVTDHDDRQLGEEVEAELLAQLRSDREQCAGVVSVHEERAAASRRAVEQLDAERLAALDEGRDAAPLRERRRSAEDDARDSADAAGIARAKLAAIDQQIAAVTARQELAAMRAELAAAMIERDAVCAQTGERQRVCVQAVRAAAEGFVLALSDERGAIERVDQLAAAVAARATALGEAAPVVSAAVSTGLWVDPSLAGPQPVALGRAFYAARNGQVADVAVRLGECNGWLPAPPPTAEEIAAWQARQAQMAASVPAPQQLVQHPAHWPAAVGMDGQGNPLAPPDPERPRPQQVVRPGALGFQPWPG